MVAVNVDKGSQAYADHKAKMAERSREKSASGRDIGPLPPIKNPERRDACRFNFRLFCETYHPRAFRLKWSKDHIRIIGKIQRAVLHGGLLAIAMPRGSGKTTLLRAAAQWALLYGHRRWVCIIAGTERAAGKVLAGIKQGLSYRRALAEDFPESVYPIRKLENNAKRCIGQTLDGERTDITWTAEEVCLPTVAGSEVSGSRITAVGITGNVRGQFFELETGEVIRPDFTLVDDPQTKESARSASQVQQRLEIMESDVLGLAGPDVDIAGFVAVTVVAPRDLADQILDPREFSEYRGERTKMLYAEPTNQDLWDQYGDIRRAELLAMEAQQRVAGGVEDEDLWEQSVEEERRSEATDFYLANREAMDAGADVAWPERHPPRFVSAIEYAMFLKLRSAHAFASEYQNEPLEEETGCTVMDPADFGVKVSPEKRGVVPDWAEFLTAHIDMHGDVLYWLAIAWSSDFTGCIVDYGTGPDQRRQYFAKSDARKTMAHEFPQHSSVQAQSYAMLESLCRRKIFRVWERADGTGIEMKRVLVDVNWPETSGAVRQFCADSAWKASLTPSIGKYFGAKQEGTAWLKKQKGRTVGVRWRTDTKAELGPETTFDTNYWKSFIHQRMNTGMGAAGCLTMFNAPPAIHQMVAEQLCVSEKPITVSTPNREVVEWTKNPGVDNHFFDNAVGACVAASMEGARMVGDKVASSSSPVRRRKVGSLKAKMEAQARR